MKQTKEGVQMNPSNYITVQSYIKAFGQNKLKEAIEFLKKYEKRLIPLAAGQKIPKKGAKWRDTDFPFEYIVKWFKRGGNVGIRCGDGYVVLDLDDPKDYEDHFKNVSTLTVETPNGYHLVFETEEEEDIIRIKEKFKLDIQATGTYVVTPYSRVDGKEYRIIKDVPVMKVKTVYDFISERLNLEDKKKRKTGINKPSVPVSEFEDCEDPILISWKEMETILNDTYLPIYIQPELDGYRDVNILLATMNVLRRHYTKEMCDRVLNWINAVAEQKKVNRSPDIRHYDYGLEYGYGIPELEKRGFKEFIDRVVPPQDPGKKTNTCRVTGENDEKHHELEHLEYNVYNDPVRGECGTYKENKDKDNKIYTIYNIQLFAGIKNITIVSDPLTGLDELVLEMVLNTGKTLTVNGPDPEYILRNNKLKLITANTMQAAISVVNNIIAQKWESITHITDPGKTGIFYFNDRIYFKNINVPDTVDKERLRSAMRTLEKIVFTYGYNKKEELANLYKVIMAAPFEFMAKQLRNQGLMQFREAYWLTMLFMYGIGRDGKSFHANNIIKIWGQHIKGEQPEWNHGDGAFDTAARIGDVLSETTFPKALEEINTIFHGKKNYLLEIVKRGRDAMDLRGIVIQGNDRYSRQMQKFLSLSVPIITTNKDNIDLMKALERRTLKICFDDGYKKQMDKKLNEFQEEVIPDIDKLSEIGAFILKEVSEKGIGLITPHELGFDFADGMIDEIYKLLNENKPEFWNTTIDTTINPDDVYAVHTEHFIKHLRDKIKLKTRDPIYSRDYEHENEHQQTIRAITDTFRNHRSKGTHILLLKTDFKELKDINHDLDHVRASFLWYMKKQREEISIEPVKHGSGLALSIAVIDLMKLLDYKDYSTKSI